VSAESKREPVRCSSSISEWSFIVLLLSCVPIVGLLTAMATAKPPTTTRAFEGQTQVVTETATKSVQTIRGSFQDYRVQIATVVVLVVLGLTLWLLGARAGRILFGLLLGTASVIPGMYLAQVLKLPLWPGAIVGGLLGMLLGVFIFKIGIMLVGLCMTTILLVGVFAVLCLQPAEWADLKTAVRDYLAESPTPNASAPSSPNITTTRVTVTQSDASRLGQLLSDLGAKYRNGLLLAAVVGGAIGLLLQLFARPFMLVLTTSCVGTAMILGGVYLGLTFEGHPPDELLGLKPLSTAVVFVIMLGLGILVQMTMTKERIVHTDLDQEQTK